MEQDLQQKKLTKESAKALLGVHKRHGSLADEPSTLDMELLIKLYRGKWNSLCANHYRVTSLNLYSCLYSLCITITPHKLLPG